MMHRLLSGELAVGYLDRVEAAWRQHGPPADVVDRILAVQKTPDEWRSLLLPGDLEDGGAPGPPSEPREPKPPLDI